MPVPRNPPPQVRLQVTEVTPEEVHESQPIAGGHESERVVADLPMGYAVVARDEVPVATAVPYSTNGTGVREDDYGRLLMMGLMQLPVSHRELIPYPEEGAWHHELCERCCDCGRDCWMAWLCPIFPLAQIAERFVHFGILEKNGGYNLIMVMAAVWIFIDLLLAVAGGGGSCTLLLLCGLICFQMRVVTRATLGIAGSKCDDCLLSFFCNPCTVIQMVGTLWAAPKQVPGCSIGKGPAYAV